MMLFLLTKSPNNERTRLGLLLVSASTEAEVCIFLAADGVYCLLEERGVILSTPGLRVYACEEDLLARGVCADEKTVVPADFYGLLVLEMMREGARVYCF